jgi:hypothetical protein
MPGDKSRKRSLGEKEAPGIYKVEYRLPLTSVSFWMLSAKLGASLGSLIQKMMFDE